MKGPAIMEQFTCSLCGGTESRICFQAYDFDRSAELFEPVQCTGCGLAATKPVPEPSAMDGYYPATYYGGGRKKFSGVIEFLTVLGSRLRARKIFKATANVNAGVRPIKVLDVGCGRANLLCSLKEYGCECHGTERSKFPADIDLIGIKIFKGSVAEGEYNDGFFDAVSIWHVLEHLDQPFETLDEVARITRTNGIIVIAVPNFSSLQSTWFKSDWFHLDLPRHLYHFDAENLCQVLRQKGYAIESISTTSLEQNIFGFVQSFMNKLKYLGKSNEFYKLIQKRSGLKQTLKLILWLIIAILILPFAVIEFVISCILARGACAIVYAHKI
jgi:2-polyprenyl-3-methyl-5-hydroxy-6-metoxy-1,4-benzoquinol methylase